MSRIPFLIRPFAPEDYEAIASACSAAYSTAEGWPLLPTSADDLLESDAERDRICRFGRWVAEVDGKVVGACEHDQTSYRYHPRKFWADVYVEPAWQGKGIGGALYEHLLDALAPLDPLSIRCNIREDMERGQSFLLHRGWQERMRQYESLLDASMFDATPYEGHEQRLAEQGIQIRTLTELAEDPERDRKLYDMVWSIRQDLPELDAATRESFEDFTARRLYDPDIYPEAYFVAVHDGAYAGYSCHTCYPGDERKLRLAQTGVLRPYRRHGIALALKLRGIAYARTHGFQFIRTVNESTNEGILSLNKRLGYVQLPAWLDMVKTFGDEGAEAPSRG